MFLISIRNKCNQGKLLTFTSKLLNDIKFQITTLVGQYYTEDKLQHTQQHSSFMHFYFNADNYPFFQGNRLPTILLNRVFPLFSMASPFTRPCCEVSEVESGISTIISMAIDSCCGKQRIRGFLQNRVYHQQSCSPPYPLPEAAQRAGRSKPYLVGNYQGSTP